MNLPKLKILIIKTWEHDVTFSEATKGIKPENLRLMEKFLQNKKVWTFYENGIPFPSEENFYAGTKAGKLIQKMYDNIPKLRIQEILSKVNVVDSKTIVQIIKNNSTEIPWHDPSKMF